MISASSTYGGGHSSHRYIKLSNATATISAPGALRHGPEGCRYVEIAVDL
jgi:hypothetical protein